MTISESIRVNEKQYRVARLIEYTIDAVQHLMMEVTAEMLKIRSDMVAAKMLVLKAQTKMASVHDDIELAQKQQVYLPEDGLAALRQVSDSLDLLAADVDRKGAMLCMLAGVQGDKSKAKELAKVFNVAWDQDIEDAVDRRATARAVEDLGTLRAKTLGGPRPTKYEIN